MNFVPLRVHSFYTLGEGTASPEALVARAAALGLTALALTDTLNLYGAFAFLQAARSARIHPVMGVEALIDGGPAPRASLGGAAGSADRPARPVLLARNPDGYAALCRLITRAWMQPSGGRTQPPGWQGRAPRTRAPAVAAAELAADPAGLVCLDGGPDGLVGRLLLAGDRQAALAEARRWRGVFGPDFYLELQAGAPVSLNRQLLELGRHLGIPVVATWPAHPRTPARSSGIARPFPRIARPFRDVPEALRATVEIAARCGDPLPPPSRPAYLSARDDPSLLRALAFQGLDRRYPTAPAAPEGRKALETRLSHELAVIEALGLAGYFLILWDLVRWCRAQGIPVGPGRGSAVGSLACYALAITEVDPIRHGLYFERFLNPERPDPPDVDLDLCSRRRPEALAYLARRYGTDRTAQVGVVATLGARGAVRAAGALLGVEPQVVEKVAAILPRSRGPGGLAGAVASLPEFRRLHPDRPPLRALLQAAARLEGMPAYLGAHPSGVVVSPLPLTRFTPLQPGGSGGALTQLQADALSALGLIKLDLLGLRNLTVIDDTLRLVAEGGGPRPDARAFPGDDAATFRMLQAGESIGCFQLDSPGIRRLLRQVRPRSYEDLVAVLSLYRPGPWEAGAVQAFVRRRHGLEPVPPLHPWLEPLLHETHGLLLYQEQVMRIAVEVAGFSLAQADALRRALARGGAGVEAFRAAFVEGAASRGVQPAEAGRIFDFIARFSGYSFNKAHTAAYARITLQTAYLKAHHPVEYFAALLASGGGYFAPEIYGQEAERLGIRLLGPHVNRSGVTHRPEGGGIRTGLVQVPGIGPATAAAIVRERERRGPFRSVKELAGRARLGRGALEALARSGALEGLEEAPRQLSLFGRGPGELEGGPAVPAATPGAISAARLAAATPGARVRCSGRMVSARRLPAPDGQVALRVVLQDATGMVEAFVPPAVYRRDLLEIDPAGMVVDGDLLNAGPVPRLCARALRACGGG